MQVRSNISVSLRKKRKANFRKKIVIYLFFIIIFISVLIFGLNSDKVRIKEIMISGNSSVLTEDILKIAKAEMERKYLWIIPSDNIFLLHGRDIQDKILSNINEINSISILINGISSIEIVVKERESKNLWCKGRILEIKQCYFMDSTGYIFEEAPNFSENTFPIYLGLITDTNPIGQYYFKDSFKNISGLFDTLKRLSFLPKYIYTVDEHEYEVYIQGGGKILLNDKKSFESSIANLQALLNSGYIKNDLDFIKKIKFIDLRFGNKVNFELVK